MNRTRDIPTGFSLLELMLATAMAAMLAMSLYLSMSIGLTAQKGAFRTIETAQAATIAAELVRQDFEAILAPTGTLAGPFYGLHKQNQNADADMVEFFCIGSDGGAVDEPFNEGLRRVTLELRTDVSPPALVRSVTRNLLATVQVDPVPEVLCRNVRSFSLRYFDGAFWQEEWDSTTMGDILPLAVAITIEIDDPSAPPIYQAGALAPTGLRITRIVPLACAQPADSQESTGITAAGGMP